MADMRKARVLVVDDDPILVELLCMAFEMHGYEVLSASDGAEVVALLQNQGEGNLVDIMVVDLKMPVMDGLGLVRWVRTEWSPVVPILVLTGQNKEGVERLVMEAGATAMLCKPVDSSTIIDKVAAMLDAVSRGA